MLFGSISGSAVAAAAAVGGVMSPVDEAGKFLLMIRDFTIAGAGAVLFGYGMIALFFWRFWRRTRALLFACFALAFLILAAERAMILTAVADLSTSLSSTSPGSSRS